jgi:hypothetical protein
METYAVDWTEWVVHRLMFWEDDNKRKGRILRAFHQFGVYALLTLIVISHTLYRAFWLQTLIFFFCVAVWVQHVATHGCVFSKVEQRLLEDEVSFIDPYLELFHIETNNGSKSGLLVLGSTLVVSAMGLEWVSRFIGRVLPLIVSSVPRIPPLLSSPSG